MHLLFSFNKYLLSIDYVPGLVLGTGDMKVNKTNPGRCGIDRQWMAEPRACRVPCERSRDASWFNLGTLQMRVEDILWGLSLEAAEGAVHDREGGRGNWETGDTVGSVQNGTGGSQGEGGRWLLSLYCARTVCGRRGPASDAQASWRRFAGQDCWEERGLGLE